jgi:hypothetical protein
MRIYPLSEDELINQNNMLNATQPKKHLKAHTMTLSLELLQATINKFLEISEEFFTSYLEMTGKAWWVKIITKKPDCIYYFGPFTSHREAQLSQLGYLEDLEQERPQLIAIEIKQCQPEELTIFEDEWGEKLHRKISPDLSA